MTKLRSSSHTLDVERGRYTKPRTNICEWLCPAYYVIDDETIFFANCKLYDTEGTHFFGKMTAKYKFFMNLTTQLNPFYWFQARKNKLQHGLMQGLSADVIVKRMLKHDGCCGADNTAAGANGGVHTMTASVGTGEYVTHGIATNPYFCIFDHVIERAWRLTQAYP